MQDETFPELQAASGETEEGGEHAADERPASTDVDDRGGAAFPKAFERELVTPTALQVPLVLLKNMLKFSINATMLEGGVATRISFPIQMELDHYTGRTAEA